ncbi:MAG: hypothetical protein PSX36_01285 [bacterium]|nr:hypothetical protein [bacterium]
MMKKSIILFWLATLLVGGSLRAQVISEALVETPLVLTSLDTAGKTLKFLSQNAKIILNISTGDFTLRVGVSKLRSSDPILDTLLKKQKDQNFVFIGKIEEDMAAFNDHMNDGKSYNLPGVMSIGGASIPCIAQYSAISLAEKSESKNFRMNFRVTIDAATITVKGLEGIFKKEVGIEISGGMINIRI